jgi:hypothetical protein
MKLFSFLPFPPGGFAYVQDFNGTKYNFPDIGLDISGQARLILKFRKANGLARASFDEALSDLNEFTCARLGNNSRWCGDGNTATMPKVEQKGCGSCGAPIT